MTHKIYQMPPVAALRGLTPNSVGAIITDPSPDLSNLTEIITAGMEALRPGGALVTISQGVVSTAWDASLRERGMDWMAEMVVLWTTDKPRNLNFGSLHTRVNWYSKPGARHTFNSGERCSVYSNVIVCKRVPFDARSHPNEKPVSLTNFLVTLLTHPNDLVVDPFCGSGSTLISAEICGRDWVGSDSNPQYCELARKRIREAEFEDSTPLYLWSNGKMEAV